MCFSATASFALGGALIPAGVYAMRQARRADGAFNWMPFAAYPLVFGVQQVLEGFVWLGLATNDAATTAIAARGFMFFSHFFWLVWVPFSVRMAETDQVRRKMLLALGTLGGLLGLAIYLPAIVFPQSLSVQVVQRSIDYTVSLGMKTSFNVAMIRVAYSAIIIGGLILSSDRRIQFFGLLVAVSLAMTYLFYSYALISVWCFFAAALSGYLAIIIMQDHRSALADNSS